MRRLVLLGVLLLVVADVALVFLALRPRAGEPTLPPATAVVPAAGPATGAAPTTQSTTEPAAAKPLGVALAAVDAKVAWRATVGTCTAGGAKLETTTDGGQTWTAAKAPTSTISRVQPQEGARGFVVAAGKDCVLEEYGTTNRGASWADPVAIDGGWARSLKDPTAVITPKEADAQPCGERQVLDLARGSSAGGLALCSDGAVMLTTDGGTKWAEAGSAQGGLALASRVEGSNLAAFVARTDAACEGIQIVKAVADGEAKVIACVAVKGTIAPGTVAFSAPTKAGWLIAGDETWVATADLKSWKQAPAA